jgi:hypothetical protein
VKRNLFASPLQLAAPAALAQLHPPADNDAVHLSKQATLDFGIFNLTDRKYFLWSDRKAPAAERQPRPLARTWTVSANPAATRG